MTTLPHCKGTYIFLLRPCPVCAQTHLNSPRPLAEHGLWWGTQERPACTVLESSSLCSLWEWHGKQSLALSQHLLHFFPVRATSFSPVLFIERFYCCCLLYEQNACYACAKRALQLMFTSTLGAAFLSLWMAYLRNFCCGFKSVWQKDNFCTGFASWRWDCTQVYLSHWS